MRSGLPEGNLDLQYRVHDARIRQGTLDGRKLAARSHLYYIHELLDCRRRFLEGSVFFGRQLDFDHLIESASPEFARYAHEQVPDTIFALQEDRAGQDFLLVQQNSFDHLDNCRARSIPGAGPHELCDLCPAVCGPCDDGVDRGLVQQVRYWYSGNRRVSRQRHHRVAVPSEHECVDIFNGDAQLFRNERAHSRRIEYTRHADDSLARKLTQLVNRLSHRIEGIGHRNDDAVGRIPGNLFGDLLHDFVVHVEQVVAAHARLPGYSGRDHDNIGAGALGVVTRTQHAGVRAPHRAGLEHVERNTGGFLIRDIYHDDGGKFFFRHAPSP